MIKLTKSQRQILQTAIESQKTHGSRKPISIFLNLRNDLEGHPKAFQAYCNQMYKLLDAGIIEMGKNDGYAYIANIGAAQNLIGSK